jgi:hypothetical protein
LGGRIDEDRPGGPRKITDGQVVVMAAPESTPKDATHRSRTSLEGTGQQQAAPATVAKRCGLSKSTVARICTAFRLKPHRSETFTSSMDRCSSRRFATESYMDDR